MLHGQSCLHQHGLTESLILATQSGTLEGKGKSHWYGGFAGHTVVPNLGAIAIQLEADTILAQALVLEARGLAGSATAAALKQKYGGGKYSSEPEQGDYRGRYNYDRIKQGKKPLPSEYDAHHRIPQNYRDHPEFKDFDFDAPSNIRGIRGSRAEENLHQRSQIGGKFLKINSPMPQEVRSKILLGG